VALERRVDSNDEAPGCGNVELLTDVKLPGDSVLDNRDIVGMVIAIVEVLAVVLMKGNLLAVDEDVEETKCVVMCVVMKGLTLAVDDGVRAPVDDIEVPLAVAKDAEGVEVVDVMFTVISGVDVDVGDIIDDTEKEVVGLLVASDVRPRRVVLLADSDATVVKLSASDEV